MQASLPSQKAQLRRQLRTARRQAHKSGAKQAEHDLRAQLQRLLKSHAGRPYASYRAYASEISPQGFEQLACGQPHHPRIGRQGRMRFYPQQTRQQRNRHGIQEPQGQRHRPLWAMRFVLLPLLGFDHQGFRLGQGGGYYDRALASLRFRRPLLIGLAYDCQRVEAVPREAWDQPLDAVVTPTRIYRFNRT